MLPTADGATCDANPSEAFATLGHETRLDVLDALWEVDEPMRYEALRRTVAPDDRGTSGTTSTSSPATSSESRMRVRTPAGG